MTSILWNTREKVCDKYPIKLKFFVLEPCMSYASEKIVMPEVSRPIQ